LFCVKATDNEASANTIATYLDKDATVISLQNGPDNVPRIRAASGVESLACVVYVGAEMAGPGRVKHTARGELIIGTFPRSNPGSSTGVAELQWIARIFQQAKVPCAISDNIELEIWKKLIINCALNAVSALGQARYLAIVSNPFMRDVIRQVVDETTAVAGATGVDLSGKDWTEVIWKLAHSTPHVISSTAQDITRHKRTEIDSFNGYIALRGKELGISTPVNQTLHALVKLLESSSVGGDQ
jgi:2-dehydropantoate 2-reductase